LLPRLNLRASPRLDLGYLRHTSHRRNWWGNGCGWRCRYCGLRIERHRRSTGMRRVWPDVQPRFGLLRWCAVQFRDLLRADSVGLPRHDERSPRSLAIGLWACSGAFSCQRQFDVALPLLRKSRCLARRCARRNSGGASPTTGDAEAIVARGDDRDGAGFAPYIAAGGGLLAIGQRMC
jgi:hypothetical protein